MSLESLSSEDNKKLRHFFTEGKTTLQQIEDLQGGLKDTTKALAEEFGIKPTVLIKALKASFKDSFQKDKEAVDEVENILHLAGE